jgi:translation initiation factor 2 subunit 2
MEDLPLVDFTQVKKKRPVGKQNLINKLTEASELDDFVIKKSKKVTVEDKENENPLKDSNIENTDKVDGEKEYNYEFLLDRITDLIKKHNPNMTDTSRGVIKIPIPLVNKAGTSRSAWTNFTEVCSSLNRPTDHLFQFIIAELGTEGSIGGENQVLLKGRYNNKHVESLLKKYVHDYIQCYICKSSATVLKKDNSARLQVLECTSCKSTRTIAPIKVGVAKASRR